VYIKDTIPPPIDISNIKRVAILCFMEKGEDSKLRRSIENLFRELLLNTFSFYFLEPSEFEEIVDEAPAPEKVIKLCKKARVDGLFLIEMRKLEDEVTEKFTINYNPGRDIFPKLQAQRTLSAEFTVSLLNGATALPIWQKEYSIKKSHSAKKTSEIERGMLEEIFRVVVSDFTKLTTPKTIYIRRKMILEE
jgi:hypothetical protein